MKRSIFLLLLLFSFVLPIINFQPYLPPPRPEHHHGCERMDSAQSLNYLGTSLTVRSDHSIGSILCPGDAVGDLNEAYLKIQDCNLTMFHKDKMIWSKGRRDALPSQGKCSDDEFCFCVFALKRNGNLVLHQEEIYYSGFESSESEILGDWITEFHPIRTELTVKDQQIQIIRTFSDGSQRLFYLDENHPGFTEDMGEPVKRAQKSLTKNHSDPDKTILRRNEYIGDLNGTHLILQPNCKLQLLNKNTTIWSFTEDSSYDTLCDLNVAQDNTIELSRRWMNETLSQSSIIGSQGYFEVVESMITFADSEPIVIQTLKNGSEIIFYGGRLKRQLTQIAEKTLTVKNSRSSDLGTLTIPRMGYVGNLTGLHLILEHNCSFMLINGNEKLWEFQGQPRDSSNAALECSVELQGHGEITLFNSPHGWQSLLEYSSEDMQVISGLELTLENDEIVVKRTRKDRRQPDIFYAGRQTNGTFFKLLGRNSIAINNRNYHYDEILSKMSYIGDLNGVYALLDQNCNLVLYNKTQILWESGTSLDHTSDLWASCGLGLHDDMQVKISGEGPNNQRKAIWSAMDFRPNFNFGQLLKAKLSIINNELWLIYSFQDGTLKKEKASQGTNHFTNNLVQFQPQPHTDLQKIKFCSERNATQSINYGEANLTSNSNDPQDLVLCLGDTFGDPNETYVTFECCSLVMYHKGKRIWSSNAQRALNEEDCDCAFSLERDGNLVLYGATVIYPFPGNPYSEAYRAWDSQTNFNPIKSELMVKGQQLQFVQTFKDGTQRLFYADENHQEFIEDMGTPIKIADKFIIKSHLDEDKTILRRNEYIGDLNGTHLVLQPNCDLQLISKNKTIWWFRPSFRHTMNCTLNIAPDKKTIEISRGLADVKVDRFDAFPFVGRESLIKHEKPLHINKSLITFDDDQPIIIQTLKNGSELTFWGMSGQNSGLSPKKELTQIAPKAITLQSEDDSKGSVDSSFHFHKEDLVIRRMGYIGNLNGLHLILQQNCSLILADGNRKLWELQSEPRDNPVMECSVHLDRRGAMYLGRESTTQYHRQDLLENDYFLLDDKGFVTGVQLTLENDQIFIKRERANRGPDIFHAGPKTNGSFFQFINRNSVLLDSKHKFLLKMGYIGDLNGVYTMLDKRCSWVLYNKTQIIWESGSDSGPWDRCYLEATNRELQLWSTESRISPWLAFKFPDSFSFLKEILKTQLLVDDNGLWVIQTFKDGTAHNYKAIPGTDRFELVSKTYEKVFGLDL